jgi:hypothetical protein
VSETERNKQVIRRFLEEAVNTGNTDVLAVPAATLDEYVGQYPLAPTFVIVVRREGEHLTGQATGQSAFRMWASAPDEFFLKVAEAQITFTRGADGKVNGLVLHQNGRDMRAERATAQP